MPHPSSADDYDDYDGPEETGIRSRESVRNPAPAPTPPHNLDAEAAVLSAVLLDPERLPAISYLRPMHFYSEAHRQIYQAVLELRDQGGKIDIVTVADRLKDKQRLAQVGGTEYLIRVADSAPVITNLDAYAQIVHDRYRLREVELTCKRISESVYRPDVGDVQKFADGAVGKLAAIANNSVRSNNEPSWAAMRRLVQEMVDASKTVPKEGNSTSRTPGIPTGIPRLDRESLGLHLGNVVAIMAERGRGKSSLAIQLAMHAAGWRGLGNPIAQKKVVVRYFPLEMGKKELNIKMLANAASVDSKRIVAARIQPTLTQAEWDRIYRALPLLDQLKILIDERSDIDADEVADTCMRDKATAEATHGAPLACVVVDYLQRLRRAQSVSPREGDLGSFNYSSIRLKNFAKDEQLAMIWCVQMNPPDPAKSKTGKPYEWLAYGSKQIEKEASDIYCLWRKGGRDNNRDIGLVATKMRGGTEFEMDLLFEPEFSRFTDAAYVNFQQPIEYLNDYDQ